MTNTIQALLLAFAMVESSNNPNAIGDNGKAYGLYQFHEARYLELGGQNYGNASVAEQNRVMTIFITNGLKKAKTKGYDPIVYLANCHNIGHYTGQETPYVKKIRRALTKQK